MRNWLIALLILLIPAIISSPVWASLPTQVGDTPLPSLSPMLKQTNPAVVNIATTATIETPLMRDPIFGLLIPGERRKQSNSLGSGVIVDAKEGIILTNHHVIQGADEIQIALEGRARVCSHFTGLR